MPRVSSPCLFDGCNKKVVNGIACDVCDRWAHKTCTGLPENVYALLKEVKALEWVCPVCKNSARNALVFNGGATSPPPTSTLKFAQSQVSPKLGSAGCSVTPCRISKPAQRSPWLKTPPTLVQECSTTDTEGWKVQNGKRRKKHLQAKPDRKLRPSQFHNPPKRDISLEHLVRDLIDRVDAIKGLQKKYEHNLGRTKNILVHAPEPEIKEKASRFAAERALALKVLRSTGISPLPSWMKIHRVGKWVAGQPTSRPLLLGFASMKVRDQILSKAETVKSILPDVDIGSDSPGARQRRSLLPHHAEDSAALNALDTTVINIPRVCSPVSEFPVFTASPRRTRSSSTPAPSKNGGSWVLRQN